ncbi:hypothetical protein KEF85_06540 [Methylomonas paludis]|uniref:Uncharacterized protein n=1 Tax=Methylomonas paludis TaxID=1173101 RepID=A0A975MRB6_9GAMM|nr:hypothetical protein [Methylomonas paludis]QWF72101.1 hypothetical protein KEF85_06540 [Methylomonas paludis]
MQKKSAPHVLIGLNKLLEAFFPKKIRSHQQTPQIMPKYWGEFKFFKGYISALSIHTKQLVVGSAKRSAAHQSKPDTYLNCSSKVTQSNDG